jgi:hypothetical protein
LKDPKFSVDAKTDANAIEWNVCIEILGLEGESMNEKWTINPIKWGSLSMSAGVNPMNFWLI